MIIMIFIGLLALKLAVSFTLIKLRYLLHEPTRKGAVYRLFLVAIPFLLLASVIELFYTVPFGTIVDIMTVVIYGVLIVIGVIIVLFILFGLSLVIDHLARWILYNGLAKLHKSAIPVLDRRLIRKTLKAQIVHSAEIDEVINNALVFLETHSVNELYKQVKSMPLGQARTLVMMLDTEDVGYGKLRPLLEKL